MVNRVNKKLLYISSFFIPVILYLFIFSQHGIWPFGDSTVMTGDMRYQFTDYLSYLKTIVFSNNDLSYSFSKNLGGNMAGFSAYYYLCPLNWITLLFPSSLLPVAEGIILILYAALSSMAFTYMLSKLKGESYLSLPFAVAYSMMGYTASYFQLSIYFADLIVFPLIILGIERIINNAKDNRFYLISLFIAVLSNYYLGYMICIFSVIYYIFRVLSVAGNKTEIKGYMKNTGTFILTSVLSVALTAFSLLPAVLSLSGEKDTLSVGFFRKFEMKTVFSQFFTGAFSGNVSNGLPNIFCGIIMVFLCILYLMDKKIKLKVRLLSLGLLIFLFINLYINTLNVVWHGFNQPIGFPYRYSFIISFLLIYFSYEELLLIKNKINIKGIILVTVFILTYGIFIFIRKDNSIEFRDLLLDFIILFLSAGLLLFAVKKKNFIEIAIIIISFLEIIDITYNASDVFNYFDLASLSEYQEYLSGLGEKIDWIKNQDDGFYRIEKDFRRTNNDAMQFNYAGLSHFSSSEKKDKINFMGKLGFRNNGNWAFYNESTTRFIESFLGMKYFISEHNSTANKHKRLTDDHEDIIVYANRNPLPIMFAANSSVRNVNYNGYNNNPFALQTAISDGLNNSNNNIFEEVIPDSVNKVNLTEEAEDGYIHYKKVDTDTDAYIEYSFTIDNKDCLYAYFDAPSTQEAEIYCNDQDRGEYFTTYRWNIVNLYDYEIGDKIKVKLFLKGDSLDLTNYYFYYENKSNEDNLINAISENRVSLKKITSSRLEGKIEIVNPKMNSVLLTIPFDKGWNVYVDGDKKEIKRAIGILMSFDIDIGNHEIILNYSPPGRNIGIVISLISLIIIISWFIYLKKYTVPKEL